MLAQDRRVPNMVSDIGCVNTKVIRALGLKQLWRNSNLAANKRHNTLQPCGRHWRDDVEAAICLCVKDTDDPKANNGARIR